MTDSPTIAVDSVSKVFARGATEVRALSDIDLEIGAGEFVAVVGPSGCGKSTLMRLIAGLLRPSTGTIRYGDAIIDAPRHDTGIVFQKANLVPWRSILGNVLLQMELRGVPPKQHTEKARRLLDAVGLADFAGNMPYELSGGMQQRACIARALIHDPSVLLMDEPFGALDALTREQVRIDLETLWMENRMSVLFITHSIDEAVLLADRVVVMTPRPGEIDTILDVGMARPRGLDGRSDPVFSKLVEEITHKFMSRGVLHANRTGPSLSGSVGGAR
ncbi:ABC transporter ATP-binding protein [Amorphus sp. 3PC139-8]|uniref:ABC transporter ATP-binding protein n=1 Tax=Amorphus sp. 3PC139-8 TaxID=2735676 RepID=UPI00345D1B3D